MVFHTLVCQILAVLAKEPITDTFKINDLTISFNNNRTVAVVATDELYTYILQQGQWQHELVFNKSEIIGLGDALFAESIAITDDADIIVLGCPESHTGGTNSIYVLHRSLNCIKLVSIIDLVKEGLGSSVVVSTDGQYIVSGSMTSGQIYIFKRQITNSSMVYEHLQTFTDNSTNTRTIVAIEDDYNVIVACVINTDNNDMHITRYTPNVLSTLWVKSNTVISESYNQERTYNIKTLKNNTVLLVDSTTHMYQNVNEFIRNINFDLLSFPY